MPIPMSTEDVDGYMRQVLESALTGDFTLIKTKGAPEKMCERDE
jgi:hypothetical protein